MNTDRATARKILERAAELVDAGWCQRKEMDFVDGRICYCMSGALVHATFQSGGDISTYDDVAEPVYEHLDSMGLDQTMIMYNDAPERTKEEVAAMLREVAASMGEEA